MSTSAANVFEDDSTFVGVGVGRQGATPAELAALAAFARRWNRAVAEVKPARRKRPVDALAAVRPFALAPPTWNRRRAIQELQDREGQQGRG
jgi:hypothetical protein